MVSKMPVTAGVITGITFVTNIIYHFLSKHPAWENTDFMIWIDG